MKKFMCFLMIVVCFSCNNISSMAEEDFTLDIGNVAYRCYHNGFADYGW